jgi:hypothetical protein
MRDLISSTLTASTVLWRAEELPHAPTRDAGANALTELEAAKRDDTTKTKRIILLLF